MTIKKLGVLVLTAGIFCGISGYGDAKGHRGDGPGKYMEQVSPEQQKRARAILEEGKIANKGLREEIAAKRAELEEVMKSADPDSARIETLSKELGELRGKEMIARMNTTQKLKKSGLPEMTKPAKAEKRPVGKQGDRQEFVNNRIAKLPEAKQAKARKLYEEYQTSTAQTREAVKATRDVLDDAMSSGDATAVETLAATMGELQGKLLVAKAELRQKLVKADIPADTFEREGKKGAKPGKAGKDGRNGKRDRKAG